MNTIHRTKNECRVLKRTHRIGHGAKHKVGITRLAEAHNPVLGVELPGAEGERELGVGVCPGSGLGLNSLGEFYFLYLINKTLICSYRTRDPNAFDTKTDIRTSLTATSTSIPGRVNSSSSRVLAKIFSTVDTRSNFQSYMCCELRLDSQQR
jgi:hypothetical protein